MWHCQSGYRQTCTLYVLRNTSKLFSISFQNDVAIGFNLKMLLNSVKILNTLYNYTHLFHSACAHGCKTIASIMNKYNACLAKQLLCVLWTWLHVTHNLQHWACIGSYFILQLDKALCWTPFRMYFNQNDATYSFKLLVQSF